MSKKSKGPTKIRPQKTKASSQKKAAKNIATTIDRSSYDYPPFDSWQWRSFDGKKVVDLDAFIENNKDNYFFIGTDSQNYSKKRVCYFTTVLISYKMRRGGSIIIHRDGVAYMEVLRQRLLMEAMRSLEAGWYLSKKVPQESIIGIHLDVNRNLRYKSAHYKDELVGLVVAQGFNAFVKPDAWAAMSVADSKC